MNTARFGIIALPVLLVAAPFALRPRPDPAPAEQVVVITPHGVAIQTEFGKGFASWARRELGREVGVDWRTPGGTNDIIRYLDGQYAAALARTGVDPKGFNDPKADTAGRRAFLASADVSSGIDIIFGGGEFTYRLQTAKGYLVDAGVRLPEDVPYELSGERMYEREGRYLGACLSAFGIAVNTVRLDPATVTGWDALGAPGLRRATTLADPTKSGAVTTALERLIQGKLAAAARDPDHPTSAELERGWSDAWSLLKRIAGNARHITDGASKAVRDVARGDAAAGMCIDFHARAEGDWTTEGGGAPRLVFVTPVGGTSYSADPIALLRGAPHRELAAAFIRFVVSPEGQHLWNQRPGTPGGPQRYALRRLPIRRDAYADRALMSDPQEDPYAFAARFTYRAQLTGPLFTLIPALCKAILLDPRQELREAWEAIADAGGPEAVPLAWAAFTRLPFTYAEAPARLAELKKGAATALPLQRAWTVAAQEQYREAARLAREGR